MTKRAPKGHTRQKRERLADIIIPPSPYSFEETVRRVLKAKPVEKKPTPTRAKKR